MTNQPTFTKNTEFKTTYENSRVMVEVDSNGEIRVMGSITDGWFVRMGLADLKATIDVLQSVYQDLHTPTSGS